MKLWWRGNSRRQLEAEAECERLRTHLEALQSHVLALAAHEDAPAELLAAMREPSHAGEVVRLNAAGREVIAVIGEEAADARLLWHEITAAAQAAEPTRADVRVEPHEMVTGLRALAVRAGDGLVIWSPQDLPPLLRKGAARKVVAAAHGRRARIAGLLPLPAGIPALRHLIAGTMAVAAAGVVTAVVLLPSPHLGLRFPGSAGDGAQVGPAASRQAARGRSGGGAAAAPAGQAQRAPAAGASPGPVPSPSPQTSSAPSGPLPPLPSASVKASVGVSPPVPLPSVSASACVTLLIVNNCVGVAG